MTRRIVLGVAGVLVGLFLMIQLVPIRVDNPPVTQEPTWDSPRTAELAKRACYDCHSNEVRVPWYGHIAPFKWAVADHVEEAREHLNFSEMDRPQEDAHEAGEEVAEGEMPPKYYLALHGEARLSQAEWRELAAGLDATLGGEGEGGEHAEGHEEHEEHEEHEHDDD